MFLIRFGAILCTLLVASSSLAQSTSQSRYSNDEATFEQLETATISVNFFETEMEEAMNILQQETGLTFALHESAGDNNLDAKTLITLSMQDKRAATVLEFMLNKYHCAWSIRDGVVVILSEDAALDVEYQGLKTFNCADILAKIKPLKVKRRANGQFGGGGGFGGGGRGGGGVFSIPPIQDTADQQAMADAPKQEAETKSDESPPQPPAPLWIEEITTPAEQLIDLIQNTVDPDSWEENGGIGRIQSLNNLIIVRQSVQNLREVDHLLDQLRTAGLEE